MSGRALCILSAVSLILCLGGGGGNAATIYVDANAAGDGSGSDWVNACTTITAGLSRAESGDWVLVRAGTYLEAINLKSGVRVQGYPQYSAGEDVTIDATGLDRPVVSAVDVDDAVLNDFTIRGGRAARGGGIYCEGSSLTVSRCTITGNLAGVTDEFAAERCGGGGVYVRGLSLTMNDCVISDNAVDVNGIVSPTDSGGGGIYVAPVDVTLTDCVIERNETRGDAHGGGAFIWNRDLFVRCIIRDNRTEGAGGGVFGPERGEAGFDNCLIVRNSSREGGAAVDMEFVGMIFCTLADNRSGEGWGGIGVEDGILMYCILWNHGREFGPRGGSGWPPSVWGMECCVQGGEGASDSMDPPLDADPLFVDAENGDYRLRDGSPCLDRPTDPHNMYGWWEPEMVDLDGHGRSGGDGPWDIGAYESPSQYLPGPEFHTPRTLHVREEAPPGGDGSSWASAYRTISAAMRVAGTSDEVWVAAGTYPECIQVEPTSSLYGGFAGTEVSRDPRNPATNPTIIDATGLNDRAILSMYGLEIDGFTVTGGTGEEGGGISTLGSPSISRCIITGNRAERGGGVSVADSASMINCLIARNKAEVAGGGVYCQGNISLINCTVADNSAYRTGSGLAVGFRYWIGGSVTNCIFRNPGTEISADDALRVAYSCVQGGWPGEGNIEASPLFMDPESGDYHLQSGSPCIDRASAEAAPEADIESNPRPGNDGLVDMGAYESPGYLEPGPDTHTPAVLRVMADASAGGDGLSWGTAFRSIGEALEGSGVGDEVWVAGGVYREAVMLEPTVSLYGGFSGVESSRTERDRAANPTVIDATGLNRSVVVAGGRNVIDGFSLTGGVADFGAGVVCYLPESLVAKNCIVTENRAWYFGGGIYVPDAVLSATNCVFSRNQAVTGSAITGDWGHGTCVNCTFVDNRSTDGYAIDGGYGGLEILNCILWNLGPEIVGGEATYSCVQGGFPGEGNIDSIPQFLDPSNGDYRLKNGSPCIDRGLAGAAPPEDIEKRPRPGTDGLVDMGAYEAPDEFTSGPETHLPRIIHVRAGAPEGGDGASWATALPTIMGAFKIASTSDEVWVAEGVYGEAVWLEPGSVLYGGFSGTETTPGERLDVTSHPSVIDATGLGTRCITATGSAVIDGFTLQGGYADNGGGVFCAGGQTSIVNCSILDNWATGSGGGIYSGGDAILTLTDCALRRNASAAAGGGASLCGDSAVVAGCTLEENTAREGGGIYSGYCDIDISECVIKGNEANEGGGANCSGGSASLSGCIIEGNNAVHRGGGIELYWVRSGGMSECTIAGNSSSYGGGVYDQGGEPLLKNCTIESNRGYRGGGIRIGDGVAIGAGGPILVGCIISDNTATYGGGFSVEFSSRVSIRGCTVTGNVAASGTGGGECSYAAIDMIGCLVADNRGGDTGGVELWTNNLSWEDEAISLTDCIITRNTGGRYGGGLWARDVSSVTCERCSITANTATTGAGVYCSDGGSPVFSNCLISGNTATREADLSWGAAIQCSQSTPSFVNCTIAGNRSDRAGSLSAREAMGIKFVNSILWNESADEFSLYEATPEVTWSNIRGGWAGEGNIDATPEFVHPWDGSFGDYHLLAGSPCIDSASNGAAMDILTDLDGNVRIWDGDVTPGAVVDMGACEFGAVSPTPTPTATATWTPTVTTTPTAPPNATPTPIPGDVTGDRVIDAMDLFVFSMWWQSGENGVNTACDAVDDDVINDRDLLWLLEWWRQ